ncbi:MAG: hypothetical protein B6240_09840 [Desulfobacteraceae bacterium 4572_87]|nr:MAG: hypothetical protein B6240_09840 [Desulfobacteraceae bacterium 4572_87]
MLHEVSGLVAIVKTLNDKRVQDARDKATATIDKKIARLGKLLNDAGASADLRNKVLYGTQDFKKQLQNDVSIPNIAYTIGEAEEIYESAVDLIESEANKGGTITPKKEIRTIRPASLSSKTYLVPVHRVQGAVVRGQTAT